MSLVKFSGLHAILLFAVSHALAQEVSSEFLGKTKSGTINLKRISECCTSGRTTDSAELVFSPDQGGPAEVTKEVEAGGISGEQGGFSYEAIYNKDKIFFLSRFKYEKFEHLEATFWKWDDQTAKFTPMSVRKEALEAKINDHLPPEKVYAEIDPLIKEGRIEAAWWLARKLRKENYPDAFRTTSIEFETNSGPELHKALFVKVRDQALVNLKAGDKKQAGNSICRFLVVPDPVSYTNGSEDSDPCGIAKITPPPRPLNEPAFYRSNLGTCLASFGDFQLVRTPSNIGLINDLGYILNESGYHREAVQVLRSVVEASPNRSVARLNLAEAYGALGDTKNANKQYEKYFAKLGPKEKAKVPASREWTNDESPKECAKFHKVQVLVEKKTDAQKVKKALDDYFVAGGSPEMFVPLQKESEEEDSYSFDVNATKPLAGFLIHAGYIDLAEPYFKTVDSGDMWDYVQKALYDEKKRPQMLQVLDRVDEKFLSASAIEYLVLIDNAEPFLKKHHKYIAAHFTDSILKQYDNMKHRGSGRPQLNLVKELLQDIPVGTATEMLFRSVRDKNPELVSFFLDKGALVNGFDFNFYPYSQTPLDIASSEEIKKILKNRGGKSITELGPMMELKNSPQRKLFESLPEKMRAEVARILELKATE